MDKAPDAYRTISEVAEDLDLPQHVLRFWETRFAQIKPLKRGGGRRYYRPDDVEILKGVRHLLYKEGYTIKGVQRILKEQGVKAVQAFVRDSLAPLAASQPAPLPATGSSSSMPQSVEAVSGYQSAQAPISSEPTRSDAWEPALVSAEALEEREPDEADPVDADALGPESIPSEPRSPPDPDPIRGQVSMFRGGLQRGEGTSSAEFHASPLAEFGNQMRERVAQSTAGIKPDRDPDTLGARDALMMALEELVACRAAINQVLARRQT